MEVKIKTFDIRKPQVSIRTKQFLTVEKTVREMVGTAGSAVFVSNKIPSFIGDVQEVTE